MQTNQHKTELARALRRAANAISKNNGETENALKSIKQAIKTYRKEKHRLFWEPFPAYLQSRKWRPFF